MTEKPNPSPEQVIYNLINHIMDKSEPYPLMRCLFEKQYVKENYKLDWNKRLNENGEWEDKK